MYDRKLHILVLTSEYEPLTGGLGLSVARLCRALQRLHNVRLTIVVCGTWHEGEPSHCVRGGVDIYRIKFTGLPEVRRIRPFVRATLAFIRCLWLRVSRQIDLIMSHGINDIGVLGGILARLTRTPAITWAHGPQDVQHVHVVPMRTAWMKLALSMNDGVVVTNEYARGIIQAIHEDADIRVIPNIAYERWEESLHRQSSVTGHLSVAIVGRLVWENEVELKGVSYALRALTRLPTVTMTVFGDGPDRMRLEKMASDLNVAERALFRGSVARADMHRELCSVHLLLHPALMENLSMAILEAMFIGVPIVSTAVGGLSEAIRDQITATVIKPGSQEDIVRALHDIAARYDLAKARAGAAREYVKTHCSPEAVASAAMQYIQDCVMTERPYGPWQEVEPV